MQCPDPGRQFICRPWDLLLMPILCTAGSNQIDKPLLDLLQQNIDAARSAGQEQPATFMEKIKAAAQRYRLSN